MQAVSRFIVRCLLGSALVASVAACREPPEDVLERARLALDQSDEDDFLALLEPRAAAFLQRAPQVQSESGKRFRVLRDGKPTGALLPKGDVVDVVEQKHRAVLVVAQGKGKSLVPMRLVEGQWRIDLLEMDTFLENLKPRPE